MDVNDQGRCFCNVTAIVRITLADGSWHEDVGCGQSENIKSKGAALDKVSSDLMGLTIGEKGSGDRRDKASPAYIWQCAGKLLVRQGLHARGRQDQGSTSKCSVDSANHPHASQNSSVMNWNGELSLLKPERRVCLELPPFLLT